MKKSILSVLLAFVFLTVLANACAPAPTPLPTSVPPTSTPLPTNTTEPTLTPEPTFTLEPTVTPEPSPTAIVLPEILSQTFSGVSTEYRDSFQYIMQGLVPQGWACDEKFAAWVTQDNQLKIQPANHGNWSGTVFYFSKEKIVPNTGVYFIFKYTGATEHFTFGFDAVQSDGQRIKVGEKNFYSVAMEIRDRNLFAYGVQKNASIKGYFKGNLKLQENTWYNIALGLDNKDNYIIKIWQPDDPEKQLTYLRTWKDFPTEYYFISSIAAKRSLLIDDFTVFKFDSIIQK